MINLRNPLGRRVDVKIAADVASGAFAYQAGIPGIAMRHALNGATVTFLQEGLVALTLAIQGTLGIGSYIYVNRGATPTANILSLGAAAKDIEFAQIVDVLDSTNKVMLLRMNVGFPRAAAGNAQ